VLAASGRWSNGTSPVNIYYQVNRRDGNDIVDRGYFTVVDAFIIPGTSRDNADYSVEKKVEKTPGPGVILILTGILVGLFKRRTMS
jgi:hypothetical protein